MRKFNLDGRTNTQNVRSQGSTFTVVGKCDRVTLFCPPEKLETGKICINKMAYSTLSLKLPPPFLLMVKPWHPETLCNIGILCSLIQQHSFLLP